jgi:hypothetical protein
MSHTGNIYNIGKQTCGVLRSAVVPVKPAEDPQDPHVEAGAGLAFVLVVAVAVGVVVGAAGVLIFAGADVCFGAGVDGGEVAGARGVAVVVCGVVGVEVVVAFDAVVPGSFFIGLRTTVCAQ